MSAQALGKPYVTGSCLRDSAVRPTPVPPLPAHLFDDLSGLLRVQLGAALTLNHPAGYEQVWELLIGEALTLNHPAGCEQVWVGVWGR